ncbi:hypothetical protein D3C71_1529060 [compost metagenome]
MIAKCFQDRKSLFDQIILLRLVMVLIALLRDGSPERQLRLHVNTQHIRGGESSFRRTACMEAVVIDAVRFGDAEDSQPFLHIGRGESGQRKDQAVMLAPQKGVLTVYREFVAVRLEFSQAEDQFLPINNRTIPILHRNAQRIQIRLSFAPEQGVMSQFKAEINIAWLHGELPLICLMHGGAVEAGCGYGNSSSESAFQFR